MCESVYWRTCAANVFIFVLIFLWVCACVFTCIGLDKLFSSPPSPPSLCDRQIAGLFCALLFGGCHQTRPAQPVILPVCLFIGVWERLPFSAPALIHLTVAECDFSAFVLISGIVLFVFFLNICCVHDHMCIGECLFDVLLCTNMRGRRRGLTSHCWTD